jgi:hypothetical protein
VKICSLYGAGFYYIPGTDTCIKLGGYARVEWDFNANGSYNPYRVANFDSNATNREVSRVRLGVSVDARSQTEYGTLRSYVFFAPTMTNGGTGNNAAPWNAVGGAPYNPVYLPAGFIQFAGITAGSTDSFFDFDNQPYSNSTNWWGPNQSGNGIPVLAYTASFGNGFSATISLEDTANRESAYFPSAGAIAIAGREWPDAVGNLRVDQAWGSAMVAGAVHEMRAAATAPVAGTTVTSVGYALTGGLKFNTPTGPGDYFIIQGVYEQGSANYAGSNWGAGGLLTGALLQSGFPVVTSSAIGPVFDGVYNAATGSFDKTTGWAVTGGFEHRWDPKWKTSLYGAYGGYSYDQFASNTLFGAAGAPSASWSAWQIGSRTVWTPVENLDLSVEAMYTEVNSAFKGAVLPGFGTFQNKGFLSGIFRIQRNFWP